MSILVNGSPMEDFMALRGLRQGDPLSPFLFLLVVEGLIGLIGSASNSGSFIGFHFNEHIHFEMLQFSDETIFICDYCLIYGASSQC